jgi:uncharacterized protein involved in outer membrane biogenesis
LKKIAIWVAAIITVLLLIVLSLVLWVQSKLGPRVRAKIESGLEKTLEVPVTVSAAEFDFLSGRLEIRGFGLGNPEGFISPHLFTSGVFSVRFSPLSVLVGRPHIRTILLNEPDITWETRGGMDTNWKAVFAKLGDRDPGSERTSGRRKSGEQALPANGKGTGVKIDTIRIEEAVLRVVGTHSASNGPPVRLPSFDLHRPGQPDGDSGLEIMLKFMGAMAVGAQNALAEAQVAMPPPEQIQVEKAEAP